MKTYRILLLLLCALPVLAAAQTKYYPKAVIETEYGNMTVRLFEDTPEHKNNFVKLVRTHYFDSTCFHRVIKDFMIQGGDPLSKDTTQKAAWGTGGPGYTLPAEIRPQYFHKRGMLAAARQGDQVNPERRSSGSQFYIVQGKVMSDAELNQAEQQMSYALRKPGFKFTPEQREAYRTVGGSPWLDGQYTIFGEIVEGMEVIDKIAAAPKVPGDRPAKDIRMKIRFYSKDGII